MGRMYDLTSGPGQGVEVERRFAHDDMFLRMGDECPFVRLA